MAGREAQAFEKRIAHLLAEKWERHYSELRGFVRGRMALSVVRSNSLLLRGTRMGKAARYAGQDGAALSSRSTEAPSRLVCGASGLAVAYAPVRG